MIRFAQNKDIPKMIDLLGQVFFEKIFFGGRAAGIVAARTIYQNITGAVNGFNFFCGLTQAVGFQNICRNADGFAARGFDFFCDFGGRFFFQVENGNFGSALGQSFGHYAAQNSTAAGDDGNFSGQINFHLLPLL